MTSRKLVSLSKSPSREANFDLVCQGGRACVDHGDEFVKDDCVKLTAEDARKISDALSLEA